MAASKNSSFAGCEVVSAKIADIKPYDRNPRKNEKAVKAVAKSIKEFGFRQPIVVDKDGVIIVGHTRYKAAVYLNMLEVPVIYADLPADKAKEYRIADNKTGEIAEWDYELLRQELEQLQIDADEFEPEHESATQVIELHAVNPIDKIYSLIICDAKDYAQLYEVLNRLPASAEVITRAEENR